MLLISVPQQTDAAIFGLVLLRYAKSYCMFTNRIVYFKLNIQESILTVVFVYTSVPHAQFNSILKQCLRF